MHDKCGDNFLGNAMMKVNNNIDPEADKQSANYNLNEYEKKMKCKLP